MSDHVLFSIGFRCECVFESLRKYKEVGEKLTPRTIDESLTLLEDCFTIQRNMASLFSSSTASLSAFPPLIFDLFPQKDPKDILNELQKIKTLIDKISNDEQGVDVENALVFFRNASHLCLRRNDEINFSFTPMLSLSF